MGGGFYVLCKREDWVRVLTVGTFASRGLLVIGISSFTNVGTSVLNLETSGRMVTHLFNESEKYGGKRVDILPGLLS